MKNILYLSLGVAAAGLGALGAVLPMMPTIPFLMLAAFCFGRSSRRLDMWFRNTRLYRKNLADLTAGRGMTWRAKVRVLTGITVLMAAGLTVMAVKGAAVGCIVLSGVWAIHIGYFLFAVKTIR